MSEEVSLLFKADMVRSILNGSKTITRRLVCPHPPNYINELHGYQLGTRAPYECFHANGSLRGFGFLDDNDCIYKATCRPGDLLWVRETCWSDGCNVYYPADQGYKAFGATDEFRDRLTKLHHYRGGCCNHVPSIHMPRWASRITLNATKVRIERLWQITADDAIAEGIESRQAKLTDDIEFKNYLGGDWFANPIDSYLSLWEAINGRGSVNLNPWVWVIEFERVMP